MKRIWTYLLVITCVCGGGTPLLVQAQETSAPKLEYLMTYEAELELPQVINDALFIYNCKPGGWIRGPGIKGTFIGPCADWLRIMRSGVARLDVRATIKTDDGALLYLTYNGIIQHSEKSYQKLINGERMTQDDGIYFFTAPTIETSAEKYAWLNGVQLVNKFVEGQINPDRAYVRYDVYVLR